MDTLYSEIGRRIATLRQQNHLTQAQLAEKLDISIKHCSEVERGLSCFSLDKLIALCSILSTDMDYLIRGIDTHNHIPSIPSYLFQIIQSDDTQAKELLEDYILLFKKIYEAKK